MRGWTNVGNHFTTSYVLSWTLMQPNLPSEIKDQIGSPEMDPAAGSLKIVDNAFRTTSTMASSKSTVSVLGALQYFLDPTHTKLGVKVRRKLFWRKQDLDVSLRGKTAIVSGANSGIGKAVARNLAGMGAEVHMLCRSAERGAKALESIRGTLASHGEGCDGSNVELHLVDLSEPQQIKDFARDFKSTHAKVDILVNNAAVMPNELRFNSAGQEVALATNVIGFSGLIQSMAPLLERSEDARVVNVVSAGMFASKLHLPTIEKGLDRGACEAERDSYSGLNLYSQHHRARVMLTDHYADQLAAAGVRCNSVHPGWVDTPGLAGAKDMEGFYRMMGGALRDDDEGADTIVWLAACPGLRETGKYFFDRSARKKHKVSLFSTSASTSI